MSCTTDKARIRAKTVAMALTTAGFTATLLATAPVFAAGYGLKEQSASLQGNAFAGATAIADEASTIFFNPAGMARLSGNQTQLSLTYIAPQAHYRATSATRAAGLGGSAITGNSSPSDSAENVLLPALYGVWAVNPDLRLGLAINTPWGMATDYDDNWVGRYHALRSEVKTINLSPTVSYRLNPQWSIGVGAQAQYMKAKLSNAVDFGSALAAAGAGVAPGSADGKARVTGDDWGYGLSAGVLFQPRDDTRFGLSYRSAVKHTLQGEAAFTSVPAALSAAFANTGAQAGITTPETVSLGAYHDLSKEWAVMADLTWTRWSRFDELRIEFDNPLRGDSVTDEKWNNGWFGAIGVHYRPSEKWTLKAGLAFDQTPVPDSTRTPRIPDGDRYWMALGASYKYSDFLRFDAAYTHLIVDEAPVNLTDTLSGSNTLRGNLQGRFANSVDIVALQARMAF